MDDRADGKTGALVRADGMRVGAPKTCAGGLPAVTNAMRLAVSQMGLTRSARTLLRVNQRDGFDCPGCAWPDPGHRAMVEFCENGAKAVADEATRARIERAFFARHSVAWLREQDDHWINQQGRLTEPMWLKEGGTHYEPISWDDVFTKIAQKLRSLSSPDEAIFYTSGRTSNEAAFLYQLFVRQLGTNNLPDCSNMCHESSGAGLGESLGVGKGTVSLEDFERAELILVIGQNPGTNHPRMLTALQAAKRAGAKILSMNPLREAALLRFKHPQEVGGVIGRGTALTDLFLQVRVGGDIAALKGIMKHLFVWEARGERVIDLAFIARHADGFGEVKADVEATGWEEIEASSGLKQAELEQAARLIAGAERIIACWAMGLTQHEHGVANVQQVVNLLILRGALGKPGAGACPVRGHSNVQGDRTMGIYEKMPEAFLERLGEEFGFEAPRAHGLDTVGAIEAMLEGRARVFFGMGGNFVSASPDTAATSAALERCALTAHVSTKLNRSHLVTGREALILPCLGRTERDMQQRGPQFVTVEDSMSVVHRSQGRLDPASPALLSEPMIVARLAQATLGARSSTDWLWLVSDYDHIRDHIARVIPGFEDFNRRVREPDGFVLPNGVRDSLTFHTATGKARMRVHPIPAAVAGPGEYTLMTIRSHDQYNTTLYGLDDRYRGIYNARKIVLMHPEDAAREGLSSANALVTLTNTHGGITRRVEGWTVIPYDIPRGQLAAYFPEANELVPLGQRDPTSRTPASKSVAVRIDRMGP